MLIAAFPLVYAAFHSTFYVVLALLGLIWRGVASGFHFKGDEHRKAFWDKVFMAGSIAASCFQGAR